MKYENVGIRKEIAKSGLTQIKVASKLGIHVVTLNHWLGEELNDDRKYRIRQAIRELKEEAKNAKAVR